MLENLSTYEKIANEFKWKIPEYFNIGTAVCSPKYGTDAKQTALIKWQKNQDPVTFSYCDIDERSNRLANALAKLGLKQGDRVAIILPQSVETALSHIATYKSGAIAVPMARLFAADALKYRLKHSGARFIVTNQVGYEKIITIRAQLPDLEAVILIDGPVEEALNFDEIIGNASADFSPVDTKADDPALIIYTSGTTGPPKGALHAHRVLLGHVPGLQVHHEFIPQPNDIAWTPADWAWAGGLLNILLPCMYFGVPVVFGGMERFDPETAFELMSDTKTTCAFIPPTALRLLQSVAQPSEKYSLSLRTIGSGGESLGRDACEWANRELGLEVNEFYGQTECNLVLSGFGAKGIARHGAVGKPVPGYRVAVLNGNGEICQPGEPGEVAIGRPNPVMFLNYWQDEQSTQAKFKGDWMLTGDQCVVDDDGYFKFIGRDDDIISAAGYRLGPAEIEDCLVSHPAIKLAVAVGKPNALRGEIVKAYVVLNDEFSDQKLNGELLREIQIHVKNRLAANIYPREIEVVKEIPLTTTGKVIRRLFRQQAIQETLT